MTTAWITIGEHQLQLRLHTPTVCSMLHRVFPQIDPALRCEKPDVLVQLEDGYGGPCTGYELDVTRVEDGHTSYRRSDYELVVNSSLDHATIRVFDELALKHALMHLYSMAIIHTGWGLLMHASCMEEAGHAHLFIGHSGAGKSTVMRMSLPRGVFADEASILKIEADRITAYHSPFRSDHHTPMESRLSPTPLASAQLLVQSQENRRVQLDKVSAMLALMDKVFYWAPAPAAVTSIMQQLRMLVEQVPVYELHFRKEPTFWELIT